MKIDMFGIHLDQHVELNILASKIKSGMVLIADVALDFIGLTECVINVLLELILTADNAQEERTTIDVEIHTHITMEHYVYASQDIGCSRIDA